MKKELSDKAPHKFIIQYKSRHLTRTQHTHTHTYERGPLCAHRRRFPPRPFYVVHINTHCVCVCVMCGVRCSEGRQTHAIRLFGHGHNRMWCQHARTHVLTSTPARQKKTPARHCRVITIIIIRRPHTTTSRGLFQYRYTRTHAGAEARARGYKRSLVS